MFPIKKPNEFVYFESQLGLARYLETRIYEFDGLRNNPLLQLPIINTNDKSNTIIPLPEYTDEYSNICSKFIISRENPNDKKSIYVAKFFNYSKRVISCTSSGNFVIWDVGNNFCFSSKISAHSSPIRSLELTKNYTTILSGDSSGNLFYWDFNFQKKKSYKFHSEAITDISLSFNDLKFITSSDDKKAKIIDVERGEEENEFEHGSNLKSCHWNPYKSIVATAGKDNLIKIWDPKSGDCINTLYNIYNCRHSHKSTINKIRFNKNGNWLLSCSNIIKNTDIRMMKEIQTFKGHEKEINTLTWHPTIEEHFVSAGVDGNINFWYINSNFSYFNKNCHDKEIFDLSFNQTGNLLVSGSNDQTIKVFIFLQ